MSKFVLLALLLLSLAGCGSGGSNDVDAAPTPAEPSPPTDTPTTKETLPLLPLESKMTQIATFIQLANQVRYFHPSDGAIGTNWDEFTAFGIFQIAQTESHEEYVDKLRTLFAHMAPDLVINGESAVEYVEPDSSDSVRFWLQDGYVERPATQSTVYSRRAIAERFINLKNNYNLEALYKESLPAGIEVELPVVIKESSGITTPESSETVTGIDQYDIDNKFSDPYARLVAAGQLWAVIQHFYPYLDELDLRWNEELEPLLIRCLESVSECGLAMRSLLTKTGDNHNGLYSEYTALGDYSPALGFGWFNDRAVVIVNDGTDVPLGDELIEINGQSIDALIEQKREFSLRAPNRQAEQIVNFDLLRGEQGTAVTLGLRKVSGEQYEVTMQRTEFAYDLNRAIQNKITHANENKVMELEDKVFYVNLSIVDGPDVAPILAELEGASAVVLDMRNYPIWAGWTNFLPHFTDIGLRTLPLHQYFYLNPNQVNAVLDEQRQGFTPRQPFYDIPVVLLSSRYSISQNEHAFGHAQHGGIPILGDITYGINGNIQEINLLGGSQQGGLTAIFTGMKVTQHDGSRLRGVGIQPDMLVPVTLDSLQQNKDIQLEQAVDYLRQHMNLAPVDN